MRRSVGKTQRRRWAWARRQTQLREDLMHSTDWWNSLFAAINGNGRVTFLS